MSGCKQILPPQPHVADEMDTPEYQVERFGAQSPWQPTQLSGLPEHRDPAATTTTTSTDSNPDNIIGNTLIQFRPPAGTYTGKSPQRTQTTTPSLTTSMEQQLTWLQADKGAALAQVKFLQSQQSANTSLLQRTAADLQHTACKEVTYWVYSFVTTSQGYPDILSCDLNKHVSCLSEHVIIESHGIL